MLQEIPADMAECIKTNGWYECQQGKVEGRKYDIYFLIFIYHYGDRFFVDARIRRDIGDGFGDQKHLFFIAEKEVIFRNKLDETFLANEIIRKAKLDDRKTFDINDRI